MDDRFKIISCLSDPAEILKCLQEHIGLGPSSRLKPILEIASHLAQKNCKTFLLQRSVQDPDFLAEYTAYYSKTFAQSQKYCLRLHFFSEPALEDEPPLMFLDRVHKVPRAYLGFMTARPIKASPVAATILEAPKNGCFVLCNDDFDVHIAGLTFSVNGTPFMQQDNAVGACAQASIWMALRTLRRKEGISAFDPAEITSAATRFLVTGRTLPNRAGLTIQQMIEAVRFAGYATHCIPIKDIGAVATPESIESAKSKIYTYIESGIPVLLALFPSPSEGHAVVAIGHGWEKNPTKHIIDEIETENGASVRLINAASWINSFYIHNDNSGPYIKLEDTAGAYALMHACFAIPLLPNDVFLAGEEARETSLMLLKQILDSIPNTKETTEGISNKLVLRTFLSDRHKFREWALNSKMSKELKDHYRSKTLPKRVWVTELSLVDNYHDETSHDDIRVGELIIDPTGDPSDLPFLAIHLNTKVLFGSKASLLVDQNQSGEIELIPLPDDPQYERHHQKPI